MAWQTDLAGIKPQSAWTPEDLLRFNNEFGWTLNGGFDDGEFHRQRFSDGSEGGNLRARTDDGDLQYPVNNRTIFESQINPLGYAGRADEIATQAQALGMSPEEALQYIYGPGSKIIDAGPYGQLIEAGFKDPSQWKLPKMSGFGNNFLDNFADSGGLVKLMAAGVAGLGAAGVDGAINAGGLDGALGDAGSMWGQMFGQGATTGAGATAAGLDGAMGDSGSFWDQLFNAGTDAGGNLTDVQQWADSLGGLNADGSINWSAIDASPTLQSMGSISATADGAIPFGTSASGAGTLLDQFNTILNGGKLPTGSTLSGLQSLFGGGSGSGGSGGFTSNGSGGNLLPGLLGFLGQKNFQSDLLDLMRQTSEQADPFKTQRPFYQDLLRQSYNDPNFFQTNPALKGLRDMTTNDTNRSMAAQGFNMSGNQMMELGNRLQQTQMQFALPFQQQLAQNAGANINPASGALLAGQIGTAAATAGNNALGNLGYALNPMINNLTGQAGANNQYNSGNPSNGDTPNIMNSLSNLFSLS